MDLGSSGLLKPRISSFPRGGTDAPQGRCLLLFCLLLAMILSGCAVNRAVLRDPLSPEEHNDLGVAYESRGENSLARREYEAALNQNPASLVARMNLGNVLLKIGEWRAAESAFEEVVARNSNHAAAYNNLAWALIEQKRRLPEALQFAQRALDLDPDPGRSLYYRDTIGMAYLSLGNTAAAVATFRDLIARADGSSLEFLGEVYYHLGLAYEQAGDRVQFLESMRKAKALLPEGDLARRVLDKLQGN